MLKSEKLGDEVKEEISQALEVARNLDMTILLDTTGSMDHIVEAKNVCLEIIAKISADTTISSVKIAVIGYKDHDKIDTCLDDVDLPEVEFNEYLTKV